MSAIDEGIVREYFEQNGFLVRQARKYQVSARRKLADEEIDLMVFNPSWDRTARKPDFFLFSNELPFVQKAIVAVKGWHTGVFSPTMLKSSLEETKTLRAALEHRRAEHARVPALHRDDRLLHERQFVREEEKIRLPRVPIPGRIEHHQIDLLVRELATRLHLILAGLADEKSVLLEVFADNAFVDR